MALINCPECGKQNISDTALACPQCGFAIREYTEAKQREQTKGIQFEATKQKAAIAYIKQEISNCNRIMCIAAFLGVGAFLLAFTNFLKSHIFYWNADINRLSKNPRQNTDEYSEKSQGRSRCVTHELPSLS